MEFGNPLALWGLLGLVLPIIIHLISLQKAKRVYFSSTQLLRQLSVESTSRRKVKEWLILASRILALLALVLAFSMPYWKDTVHWNTEQEGLTFQVYLDNSYSMERNPGQGTLLEQSILQVQSLLKLNSPATRYQFLDNDFRSTDLQSLSSPLLSTRLSGQNFSFRSRSLTEIGMRFKDSDRLGSSSKRCFIFSDFQKSTIGTKADLDSNIAYYLVPVQHPSRSNVFIDSVWFDKPVVKKGDRLKVFYKVKNTGKEDIKDKLFKLYINNRQSAVSYLDLPALSFKEGFFEYPVSESGDLKGSVVFEDGDLSFDNSFFFTLTASAAIKVASISNRPAPAQNVVFSGEEDFILRAYRSNELNYTQLDDMDFLIIEGWNQLGQGLIQRIPLWLKEGKSILFIPDASDRVLSPALAEVLMVPSRSLKIPDMNSQSGAEQTTMEFPDLTNPFFADFFEEKNPKVIMPFAKPSLDLLPGYTPLLSTHSGEVVFSRSSVRNMYKGTSYFLHFPLEPSYTNLPQHSFFVPLLLKMALSSKENTEKRYFRQGDKAIQLSIQEQADKELIKIEGEKGGQIIPSQRLNGSLLTFELPEQVTSPGFYRLLYGGKELRTFALNTSKEESQTECYTPEELKEAFRHRGNVHVLETDSEISFDDQIRELTKGVPLWKYCLILSLLFLLVEIVLIRWFK